MFWKKWFSKDQVVPSPYGPLPTTKAGLGKSPPQHLRPLTDQEATFKGQCIDEANSLAKLHGISASSDRLTADQLDELLKAWNPSTDTPEKFNHAAYIIGFAFGDYLVDHYHLRWVVLTDNQGSDFAVTNEADNCTSFPISTVAKRLESGDRDFLGPVAFIVQRQLQELASS